MRYFIDTEFHEEPGILDLISLGIVAEDGREGYWVVDDFKEERCNDWVKQHVLPNLHDPRLNHGVTPRHPRRLIAIEVCRFVGTGTPEFWGYMSDYDWVAFCQVFGSMINLPRGWPMFCLDIRQDMHRRHITRDQLPPEPPNAHNALVDARWTRDAFEWTKATAPAMWVKTAVPEAPLMNRPRNADDMGMPPL